ncbi:MAG TPA: hypothetical protein VE338_19175 [Ktedonobacterales bacterium]|nr:hypothetical protein [Ktedonobacterales bacterium]
MLAALRPFPFFPFGFGFGFVVVFTGNFAGLLAGLAGFRTGEVARGFASFDGFIDC